MNRWHLVFLSILILGGTWLWLSRVPEGTVFAGQEPEPAVNHPAPDFTLAGLDGSSYTLADLRGKPVILNFWATWCGPCRAEMPILEAASQRYDSLVVVGVNVGEGSQIVQSFVDEFGITFPIPLDRTMEVSGRYRILGMPTTFFIDASGVIRSIWAGELNSAILAEGIQEIVQ